MVICRSSNQNCISLIFGFFSILFVFPVVLRNRRAECATELCRKVGRDISSGKQNTHHKIFKYSWKLVFTFANDLWLINWGKCTELKRHSASKSMLIPNISLQTIVLFRGWVLGHGFVIIVSIQKQLVLFLKRCFANAKCKDFHLITYKNGLVLGKVMYAYLFRHIFMRIKSRNQILWVWSTTFAQRE